MAAATDSRDGGGIDGKLTCQCCEGAVGTATAGRQGDIRRENRASIKRIEGGVCPAICAGSERLIGGREAYAVCHELLRPGTRARNNCHATKKRRDLRKVRAEHPAIVGEAFERSEPSLLQAVKPLFYFCATIPRFSGLQIADLQRLRKGSVRLARQADG